MRPLDPLSSIKVKLGVVIVAAVAVTLVVNEVGLRMDVKAPARAALAGILGLAMVQLLAHGMTSPLRAMADAARAMAAGDHGRQVRATSRDEVGELARAFNAMSAELAEVDRVRKDLVANVSHELRTPITALQAMLENIIDGLAPADAATLSTMLAQVERLGRLVAQLLDLSQLESGAVPLQREHFDVVPVLEEVAALARLHAEADGSEVRVTVRVDGRSPTVDGDAERVHQVVANLVENAVRCSPAGGTVELSAAAAPQAVTIAVSDEGPGIPPGEVDRVFERFYRVDPARSSTSGGAGLGLAIARWIVDLHGGQIRPEPVAPHGCRMVVVLPRGTAR